MFEGAEGGADYRAQSHVHRRRLSKRTNGIPYPSDYAQNAANPLTGNGGSSSLFDSGDDDGGYHAPAPLSTNDVSVLARGPRLPINGETLGYRQRRAFGQSSTGLSEHEVERRMYGIYQQ